MPERCDDALDLLIGGIMALALSACGNDPEPPQYGANPTAARTRARPVAEHGDLEPAEWGDDRPDGAGRVHNHSHRHRSEDPASDPGASERRHSGGGRLGRRSAPTLRPKDFIAGYIKALGKSSVKGGNRLTLLRDADGDGAYEMREASSPTNSTRPMVSRW